MGLKKSLRRWEKRSLKIPSGSILLVVNPDTEDFSICPTTFTFGLGNEDRETVTWVSSYPFVVQFIDRTPLRSAQFHSEFDKTRRLHLKTVDLPKRGEMQAGIFEYAVALYANGKTFLHVSGEMSMNPGGGIG